MVVVCLLHDLLLVGHDLLAKLGQLVGHLVLDVVFEVAEVVILFAEFLGASEDQGLEGVLLIVDLEDLLDEEVELLLFLEEEAGSHVLDTVVGHTDLGDEEVEQHDLHDEDVSDEEEPCHSHNTVLIRILQSHIVIVTLGDPPTILWLRKITNRVPESLQHVYQHRIRSHVLIALVRVVALEDVRDHHEDCAEGEEDNQEGVDVLGHLGKHFDEVAEVLVVPD